LTTGQKCACVEAKNGLSKDVVYKPTLASISYLLTRKMLCVEQTARTSLHAASWHLKCLTRVVKEIARITPSCNSLPFTDCEINSALPLSVTEIPRELCEQEPEIEPMLRNLIRFGYIEDAHLSEARARAAGEQVPAWIEDNNQVFKLDSKRN
jgi:hypothetical protein